MDQLHPNLNWRLLLSIEFTTKNKLNFKGHKGQKRPGFRPLRPCRWVLFLILQMVDMVVCLLLSKRTARPQGQIHPELGSWPYLAFMAFEIKIIFAVVNSEDKRSLQFKFGCNWSIGSREKPLFAIDFLGKISWWFLSASVQGGRAI